MHSSLNCFTYYIVVVDAAIVVLVSLNQDFSRHSTTGIYSVVVLSSRHNFVFIHTHFLSIECSHCFWFSQRTKQIVFNVYCIGIASSYAYDIKCIALPCTKSKYLNYPLLLFGIFYENNQNEREKKVKKKRGNQLLSAWQRINTEWSHRISEVRESFRNQFFRILITDGINWICCESRRTHRERERKKLFTGTRSWMEHINFTK